MKRSDNRNTNRKWWGNLRGQKPIKQKKVQPRGLKKTRKLKQCCARVSTLTGQQEKAGNKTPFRGGNLKWREEGSWEWRKLRTHNLWPLGTWKRPKGTQVQYLARPYGKTQAHRNQKKTFYRNKLTEKRSVSKNLRTLPGKGPRRQKTF